MDNFDKWLESLTQDLQKEEDQPVVYRPPEGPVTVEQSFIFPTPEGEEDNPIFSPDEIKQNFKRACSLEELKNNIYARILDELGNLMGEFTSEFPPERKDEVELEIECIRTGIATKYHIMVNGLIHSHEFDYPSYVEKGDTIMFRIGLTCL